MGEFPRPAALQPFVGDLHLPAVADELVENAEFVADAVAGGRNLEAGQRFHVAGRQATEAAVAKTRLLLDFKNLLKRLDAEIAQGFLGFLLDPQVEQIVVELRADQEFGGEVGNRFLGMGAHRFHRRQITGHQTVPHRVTQGHVKVMATGGGGQFSEREEEVLGHPVEHALGIEAGAFGIVVATGGRQSQIERL